MIWKKYASSSLQIDSQFYKKNLYTSKLDQHFYKDLYTSKLLISTNLLPFIYLIGRFLSSDWLKERA